VVAESRFLSFDMAVSDVRYVGWSPVFLPLSSGADGSITQTASPSILVVDLRHGGRLGRSSQIWWPLR
jgi:hypothetical protein